MRIGTSVLCKKISIVILSYEMEMQYFQVVKSYTSNFLEFHIIRILVNIILIFIIFIPDFHS